jgi:tetratricopeptide (TPR) repeat protein
VESAELAVFRRAQRLHLARDPQAVAAWDDYLRVAGQGVLVPEARYNRALCLVRLGRADEARAALEPFARGNFQGYRRKEATALLEALARGDRKP